MQSPSFSAVRSCTWSKVKGYLAPRRKWLHAAPRWWYSRLFDLGGSRSPRVGLGTSDIQRVRKVGSVCRFAKVAGQGYIDVRFTNVAVGYCNRH